MEIQHFRCFIVLAQELHFTRAAERLHLSQPHLTRIVNQIEKELGVTLVRRTTRRITLTDAGEKFLVEAQAVLARVEQAIQTMRQLAATNTGRLRIGFTEMARHCVLPKILSVFRNRYGQVQLDILENCTEELVETLKSAKVDLAFLHPPLRADFLNLISIYQERFMIALPLNHPLALQTEIVFADLKNETLILPHREHGPVLYDHILHLCQQGGFSPTVIHRDTDRSFLGLVTANMGVCFMTSSMQNAKNPGILCLPIAGDAPTLEHAVAWRRDDSSVFVSSFLQVVQEFLQTSGVWLEKCFCFHTTTLESGR
ncbi:MAG: LysR family transcriptional regulator [Scytonema sp. RU_4_4]|nr:LysR family transcriptional regulator [Scytonema sp. RU_4_4]NJR73170.1 LysR family transcriptional regulator [Scytonema sp. CRU_2_7]